MMKNQLLSSSSLQDFYASLVTLILLLGTIVNYERLFITGQSTDLIITVRIDDDASPPMVGSMYSLTCIVTGAERLTNSTIAYQWLKDGETVTEETSETLSFTSLTLSDTGSYTCQATVTSSQLRAPINNASTAFIYFIILMTTTDPPTTTVSNPVMTETVSPPPMDDVRLSFRGSPIANNSIVRITDIGDNMDSRILCITTNPDCCAMSDNRMGFWYFPSGTQVSFRSSGEDIYRTRSGAESMSSMRLATIMLGRRDERPNARGPTGLYRCVIPDGHGINQTLIVGVYSSNKNKAKIAPLIQLTLASPWNSANITFSLTCNSSGGPVQSVEWMRDGFPLDNTGPLVLTSASTASYTNTLDVSGRLLGTYTCQIRGSNNQILSSVDISINGSAVGPFNVQASQSSSSAPVEVSWSPDQTPNITDYRVFYGNRHSILVPSYVTRIVFNFVESQDEVGQTVSVRSESMHLLPSELINATVTSIDDGMFTAVSATYFSEMTLSIAVVITILVTSIFTATVIVIFMGICYLRKKKHSSKNKFATSPNMAYGLVNMEISENEREREYVIPDLLAIQLSDSQEPRYEGRVGHESVVYDLPVSRSSSPQPVVYAVPHDTTSR